ncbi:MAG TPA: DUF3892 domain-containing protein [Ignavibacteriaceae bacterium]|nr:DUF3892 domain-containing protein [Ignavibacteriaceae bacterium]
MIKRIITRTRKFNGEITDLYNYNEWWSPRSKTDAIIDIQSRKYRYIVKWPEKETEILIVIGSEGKYLRTDRDSTDKNNLLDLPDC